jgi:hypothetical protein
VDTQGTLADLQEAMDGITAPSFYVAFGSKEALSREIVELHANRGEMTRLSASGVSSFWPLGERTCS